MNEELKKEMMAFADKCFEENMERYGFSFVPFSIFKSGFKSEVEIYDNWKERMKAHKPSIIEHPKLYRTVRLYDRRRKGEGIK